MVVYAPRITKHDLNWERAQKLLRKLKRAQRSWRFMKAVPRTLHGEARHIPFDRDNSLLELITNNCILRYGSAAANGHFQAYKQLYWLEFDEESSHFYLGLGGGVRPLWRMLGSSERRQMEPARSTSRPSWGKSAQGPFFILQVRLRCAH
jgi:hypothetical protein